MVVNPTYYSHVEEAGKGAEWSGLAPKFNDTSLSPNPTSSRLCDFQHITFSSLSLLISLPVKWNDNSPSLRGLL